MELLCWGSRQKKKSKERDIMDALLSIVLPVYNGEKYLSESIESIINQTYTRWELLILDDCSTDHTEEIAKAYQAKDRRIVYYKNEQNLKLPGNLNRGFSLSTGEYLTWTSDDNKYRPDAFEKMIKALSENPEADLVFAPYQVIDENGAEIQVIRTGISHPREILSGNAVGACFMYTRHAYETVGEYDTGLLLVEDWDYWQRMVSSFKYILLDEVLYDYRWHAGSMTSTKKKERYGYVMERMLLKNRKLFGKLDLNTAYYYYAHLFEARKMQGKRDGDALKYHVLKDIYSVRGLFARIRNRLLK